jgi:hypothetical protein
MAALGFKMHHGRGGGKSTGAADAEVQVVMAMVKIGEKKRRMFEISTDVRLIKGQLRAPTLNSGTHSPTACPTMLKRHPSEGEPPKVTGARTCGGSTPGGPTNLNRHATVYSPCHVRHVRHDLNFETFTFFEHLTTQASLQLPGGLGGYTRRVRSRAPTRKTKDPSPQWFGY